MNTPAPITPTDAHYALRRDVIFSAPDDGAQLIADSEAKAVAAWSGGLDQSLPDLYEATKAERDQLRAEVGRLRSDRDCEKRFRKDAEEFREDAIERAERAEAEVSKLTDALDMMRDEFMRIIACPGCNVEIEDLANRAQLKLIQRVPVITQRDRAEAQLAKERARLDWLESNAGVDWQWSDAARTVSRASIDAFMKEETK